MNRIQRSSHLILSGFLILLLQVQGLAAELTIEQTQSDAYFELEHVIGFNSGFIKNFSGTLDFDLNAEILQNISITFQVDSVETFDEARNKLLVSNSFFDTRNYPTAALVSSEIYPDKNRFTGKVTMKGITKTVDFQYRYIDLQPQPDGSHHILLYVEGQLNREDFGLTYNVANAEGKNMLGTTLEMNLSILAETQ